MKLLYDWLLVALTPGIGPVTHLALIRHFGSASAALGASQAELERLTDAGTAQALRQRTAEADCDAALRWAEQGDRFLLTLEDHDYPLALAESYAPPPLLFGLGQRRLLQQPMLAIVGSRGAFEPACTTARAFADGLAQHGYTIVSGMASGIDSAAHQGALNHPASSIAVIGTGIDRVYPASNRALARRLASDGLILSEFALGAKPLAHHFPRRNRIIAGLSRACLVVEATTESGSLITARLAAGEGRDVMAIPGSIHNPQARGCHRLIKQGAALVETIDDILNQAGYLTPAASPPPVSKKAYASSPVIEAMGFDAITIDTLGTKLGLTAAELYAMLLQLELEGRVASLPGGRFQRLAS
jgi:DNA processing protein